MIDAPFLTDQDGLRFNLLQIDIRILERLAIDAWSQTIAHEFRRKDVSELDGIDWRIINAVMKKRPQFQLQTLHVLQDGTFVRSQNTKDMTFPRPGAPHCQMEDTLEHRCRFCPARTTLYEQHVEVMQMWDRLPRVYSDYYLRAILMKDNTNAVLKMRILTFGASKTLSQTKP